MSDEHQEPGAQEATDTTTNTDSDGDGVVPA